MMGEISLISREETAVHLPMLQSDSTLCRFKEKHDELYISLTK
jgi:hypothetical protein